MINRIPLVNLRNAEFVQFCTDGLTIINGNATVSAAVAPQPIAFANVAAEIDSLFANDPASPLTDELLELDSTRDSYMVGLGMYCRSLTYHPDAAKRDTAKTLLHSLDVYGDIIHQSYNAESASITNLLDDWATKPELVAAALAIGAGDFTTALSTTNTAFVTLYNQRTAAMAANSSPDTLKAKRAEAVIAWNALRNKIEANTVMVDGAAPWGTVVEQLNTLIDQYNATLLSRAGRSAAQRERKTAKEAQAA